MTKRELQAAIEAAEWDGYYERDKPTAAKLITAWRRGWAAAEGDMFEGDWKKVKAAHKAKPAESLHSVRCRIVFWPREPLTYR